MNIVEFISLWWKETLDYKERVLKDGGTTKREDNVQRYYQMCKEQGILNSIKFAWLGEAGYSKRTSGINTFWTKLFSLKTVTPQARRNLLTYTEGFDNAVWSKTRSSVSANVTNNPFGVLSADKLIEDTSLAASHFVRISGITVTTTNYSASVYAKASERSQLMLRLSNYWATANDAIFDLSSGTVVNTGAGLVSASITPVENGWYRCVIVSGVASSGSNGFFDIFTAASGSNTTNGDGASGIYLWGAQLEIGSSASSYQRVIDANSWDGVVTDATQTTSTSQPYITGNIAPTERIGLKNPNGGFNYMTHPTISFAANEAWSVTTVINDNGTNGIRSYYVADGIYFSTIQDNSNKYFFFINGSSATATFTLKTTSGNIGKNCIYTIVAFGNSSISLYVNGVFQETKSIATNGYFSKLYSGSTTYSLDGTTSSHVIRAQALTPSQVAAEANFLRSLYPEIPSVTIGSQVWATSNCDMVATPQGNLIQNVTLNTNTEKIVNGDFSSSAGWILEAGWSIDTGSELLNATSGVASEAYRAGFQTIGNWYKYTFTISNYTSGTVQNKNAGVPFTPRSANGTYVEYVKAVGVTWSLYKSSNFVGSIDNVSVQEVGWSDATNLYNYVYANTTGTDEQKTYAAVKAAAMWCYYNNDSAIGVIYNKLYNDYALKLLQMDIDYYNTANPTTPWGWKVPTEANWDTLEITINYDAESLKKDDTVYWSSPNAGTNQTGLTVIPAGYRKEDGTFSGLNTTALFGSTDMSNTRIGKSLRLIKT